MPTDRDDFYVGYLPAPASHRRFAKAAFVIALLVAAATGAATAWLTDDPGEATWDWEPRTVTGTLRLDPVAFLETEEGPILLVQPGKFGAAGAVAGIATGSTVSVEGTLLSREGRRMLEVVEGTTSVVGNSIAAASVKGESRRVTIEGEIIDTKCYLGAMKPGRGRTHAACARLCIRGGIPAGVVGTTDNQLVWAVIDAGENGVIPDELLNAVGEAVTINATLVSIGGLDVLQSVTLVEPN